ncbi:unnamed protein product [Dicrocoelium dendriticum]|nr:unnamed protein product [Dicrocoelium dendriticum]
MRFQSSMKAKTELSLALQSLSEKARTGTEYIQRLRSKTEMVNRKVLDSETMIKSQINELIKALETKMSELTTRLREHRESKLLDLKAQTSHVTDLLSRSTGLIQFCIEMLKERDPSSFILASLHCTLVYCVSQPLIARAQEAEQLFLQELDGASAYLDSVDTLLNTLTDDSKKVPFNEANLGDNYEDIRTGDAIHGLALKNNSVVAVKCAIEQLSLQAEQSGFTTLTKCSSL